MSTYLSNGYNSSRHGSVTGSSSMVVTMDPMLARCGNRPSRLRGMRRRCRVLERPRARWRRQPAGAPWQRLHRHRAQRRRCTRRDWSHRPLRCPVPRGPVLERRVVRNAPGRAGSGLGSTHGQRAQCHILHSLQHERFGGAEHGAQLRHHSPLYRAGLVVDRYVDCQYRRRAERFMGLRAP